MHNIKWQLNLCSMAFQYRRDKSDNACSSPAIGRRNSCETDACTAIDVHRFRFRTKTNKLCIFRRHHRRPIRFGVERVYTYAEMYSFQWFPGEKKGSNNVNNWIDLANWVRELTIDAPRMCR